MTLPSLPADEILTRLDELDAAAAAHHGRDQLAGIIVTASSTPWHTYWDTYRNLKLDTTPKLELTNPILHATAIRTPPRQLGVNGIHLNILILPWTLEADADEPTTPDTPTGHLAYRSWRRGHTLYPRASRAIPTGINPLTDKLTHGLIDTDSLTIQTALIAAHANTGDLTDITHAYTTIADMWVAALTT